MKEEEFLKQANLRRLLAEWRSNPAIVKFHEDVWDRKASNPSKEVIPELGMFDVLLGRGPSAANRPGNALARLAILHSQDFYQNDLAVSDKGDACKALLAFFERHGFRFVEGDAGNGYVECSVKRAFTRIQQSLRDLSEARCSQLMLQAVQTGLIALSDEEANLTSPAMTMNSHVVTRKITAEPTRGKKVEFPRKKTNLSKSFAKNKAKRDEIYKRAFQAKMRAKKQMMATIRVGDRVGIYWPEDQEYYAANVMTVLGSRVRVHYDDGEKEDVDLLQHEFFLWKVTPRVSEKLLNVAMENAAARRNLEEECALNAFVQTCKLDTTESEESSTAEQADPVHVTNELNEGTTHLVTECESASREESDMVMSERESSTDTDDNDKDSETIRSQPTKGSPEPDADFHSSKLTTPPLSKTVVPQSSPVSVLVPFGSSEDELAS